MMKRIALQLALALTATAMPGSSVAEEPSLEMLRDLCLGRAGHWAVQGCSAAAQELLRVPTMRVSEAIMALDAAPQSLGAIADRQVLANGFVAIGNGLEPDFSSLFIAASVEAGSTDDICAGLMLHTRSARPLAPVSLTLPPMFAQSNEQVYALALTGGTLLPIAVVKGVDGKAVMPAPFDVERPGQAATLDLILATESGMKGGDMVCPPMALAVEPLDFPIGAGRTALESGLDIPDRIARMGMLFDDAMPLDPEYAEAMRMQARQSLESYESLSPIEQAALDLSAHAMGLDTLADDADSFEQALAAARQSASISVRSAGVSLFDAPIIRLAQSGSLVGPGQEGVCPKNPVDLARMMALAERGASHYRYNPDNLIQSSTLFSAAQVTSVVAVGLTAKLGVVALGTKAGVSATVVEATAARTAVSAGASAGMGFALWGIYMDYVNGMFPSQYERVEVELDRETLTEDEPWPYIDIESVVLVTASRGWDARKSMLDIALAASGYLGVEGAVTGAARSRLGEAIGTFGRNMITGGNRLSSAIGQGGQKLANNIGPESLALGGDVLEDTAGAMMGYIVGLGASEAYGQLDSASSSLRVPPINCRVDMTDPRYSSIEVVNHHPGTFEVSGDFRLRGLQWGDAILSVRVNPEPTAEESYVMRMDYPVSVERAHIDPIHAPLYVRPGAVVELEAVLNNVIRDHRVLWRVETAGNHVLAAGTDPHTMLITSRTASDFPINVSATIADDLLMEERSPSDRMSTVTIYGSVMDVQPDFPCVEPGQSVRIRVFDRNSGDELPGHLFRFDTAGGGSIGEGGIFHALEVAEETTVTAYLRSNEEHWGQTELRIGNCSCGRGFFDPAIVERTTVMAEGYELLVLRGMLIRKISGGYNDEWATRNISIMAIDTAAGLPGIGDIAAKCIYVPAGPSAFPWPDGLNFAQRGPVFMLNDDVAGATQYAVAGQGLRSFAGEDLNQDGVVSRSGEFGGLDDERFYAIGSPLMFVERLDRGGLELSYSVNMTTHRLSPGEELFLTYSARFETDRETTPDLGPEPEPAPPPAGGGGRGVRGEPLS